MPSQQQEQQQMVQVQVAAVYCPPTANEAAAPPAVGHVPSLNRPSCSSSYATTLYTTTSCAATSCDDDVTQCEPRYSSHHALAQMQLRMQELIQTLAPVVSTWQALGPQPAPEPQSCRCVHPPTHAPLDVFTGTLAPQQEVYDLPWLLTPLPPAPARAPGQPSRLQQVHPQHPQQQQPQQQQQELMRMQPLQSQQHEASSSYLRQMPTQSVSQLPLPQQCQQPAALSSHTLRHLLLQQQPQLQAHVQQQHSLQPQQGIVVLAAVSPSSRWQQQLVLQPVLQQPPSQSAQPREYQQASSAGARSRFPRPCLPVPAVNSPYEWIMHVCKALVLTPDTTGRLAAHIFHRVEDAIRLMVAVRPRVGQGRRDDGAGGPGDMAGAERVYGMAAIWIAAKLEERRREMPRASTLAAVVSTSPGVLAAVELRILQWVDWAPLGGFVPDDSHLLTWGNC
ncbi:hypothetical protein HXX76_010174 [Chlamydomonas incerta]|uniref:Uncharacterized protein n=1 Tax=Chlamydomonas incerta TaxID=51695 RepID=A0A835VW40_CHLIN|nr:hypothetical protein HXX76_010174 [Chlamydomonas incerta]|eukprot:KAG2430075.1 hypothetical protein HXX76_010174 [Chlamydomonas incerta]